MAQHTVVAGRAATVGVPGVDVTVSDKLTAQLGLRLVPAAQPAGG